MNLNMVIQKFKNFVGLSKSFSLAVPSQQIMMDEKDNQFVPPGHFYSPIPSIENVKMKEAEIYGNTPSEIQGIDLNVINQLDLFEKFIEYYKELPFTPQKKENLRYYFENPNYSYSDAIILYSMIRQLKPNRIL